jgi:chromosome segregation ATPase
MIGSWQEKRIAIAATAYDQWPDSFKEAFRLTTIVDRIPPTLPESIALLSEVDRLTSELTTAKGEIAYQKNSLRAAVLADTQEEAKVWKERAEAAELALASERKETERLGGRIAELTQCDPSWYDASPADAFMLLKKAQERVKRMEAALRDLTNPLGYLQRKAEKEGNVLSGMAPSIARDPGFLKGIAQAALKEGE